MSEDNIDSDKPDSKPLEVAELTYSEKLSQAVDYLKGDVDGLLQKRPDIESQLDHLGAVFQNSKEILIDLSGRELTKEEEYELQLFEYAHDRGKWAQVRAEDIIDSSDWENISQALGLSEEELSILQKAKSGSFMLKDLAHHMYSAILFEADCAEGGRLSGLPEETKNKVKKAILEHHFAGFYKRVARDNRFTDDEINAVVRRPTEGNDADSMFSQACHDGDQLSMAQVGEIKGEKFHLGGYGKIVRLSATVGLNGSDQNVTTLEEAFGSADKSVVAVGDELVTNKGIEMYKAVVSETQDLRSAVLSDIEYSALKSAFRTDLEDMSQDALVKQVDSALRKHGKKIAESRRYKNIKI